MSIFGTERTGSCLQKFEPGSSYKTDSHELALKIRKHVVGMIYNSRASHIASALSVADILAVLYADILRIDTSNPQMTDRDRFILSKGHAGAAIYAALAEVGFFPVEKLKTYYMNGSVYSGHVSHKGVPGVEISTGSLGHGMAIACGMAMAARSMNRPFHTYVIVGDGECNEGVVWETALVANQYALNDFTVVVDRNGMQAMGRSEDLMQMEPFADKWHSFGWDVIDVPDGHDHELLREAFFRPKTGHPRCIIARTVKGKGISYMENNLLWHYKYPEGALYEQAVAELEGRRI